MSRDLEQTGLNEPLDPAYLLKAAGVLLRAAATNIEIAVRIFPQGGQAFVDSMNEWLKLIREIATVLHMDGSEIEGKWKAAQNLADNGENSHD